MRAEGCYGECVVKKSPSLKDAFLKGCLVTLGIVLLLAGLLLQQILILMVAAIYLYVFIAILWQRFDVTYEYVFVDGQLDFDKIMGGNARKHIKRIDMDTVEIVAPENSHALDGYQHLNLKPIDFSSTIRNEEHRVFAIINKGVKETEKILFEPNAELLSLMKSKSPRKIQEF